MTSSEQLIRVMYTGDIEEEMTVNENGGNSTDSTNDNSTGTASNSTTSTTTS